LGYFSIDGRIIIKRILKIEGMSVGNEFVWLWIGSSGGPLWKGFDKINSSSINTYLSYVSKQNDQLDPY
jgi:hypothetical protein